MENIAAETAKFHVANWSPIQQKILPETNIAGKFLHKDNDKLTKEQLISSPT